MTEMHKFLTDFNKYNKKLPFYIEKPFTQQPNYPRPQQPQQPQPRQNGELFPNSNDPPRRLETPAFIPTTAKTTSSSTTAVETTTTTTTATSTKQRQYCHSSLSVVLHSYT